MEKRQPINEINYGSYRPQEMRPGISYSPANAGVDMGGIYPNPEQRKVLVSETPGPQYL